jgi:hypothetical protein
MSLNKIQDVTHKKRYCHSFVPGKATLDFEGGVRRCAETMRQDNGFAFK